MNLHIYSIAAHILLYASVLVVSFGAHLREEAHGFQNTRISVCRIFSPLTPAQISARICFSSASHGRLSVAALPSLGWRLRLGSRLPSGCKDTIE